MIVDSVFQKIDAQTRSFHGFNPFAVLWNVGTWRNYILLLTVTGLGCWVFLGYDSTWAMLEPFIQNVLPLLSGKITLSEVWFLSQAYYGVGNHFSAPVIYGFAYVLLSQYLERVHGVVKSLNFFITTSLTFLNLGVFEWTWNLLYSNLQNQPWTVQFRWKQVSNLVFFTAFLLIGICAFIYLYAEGYRPNFNKVTAIYFLITVGVFVFWVFYPLPIGYVSVQTTTGVWTNTDMFPQTMYAVDVDPLDGLAIGVPCFVEDNVVHTVNLLAKIFTTATVFSLCKVKRFKTFDNP